MMVARARDEDAWYCLVRAHAARDWQRAREEAESIGEDVEFAVNYN